MYSTYTNTHTAQSDVPLTSRMERLLWVLLVSVAGEGKTPTSVA